MCKRETDRKGKWNKVTRKLGEMEREGYVTIIQKKKEVILIAITGKRVWKSFIYFLN